MAVPDVKSQPIVVPTAKPELSTPTPVEGGQAPTVDGGNEKEKAPEGLAGWLGNLVNKLPLPGVAQKPAEQGVKAGVNAVAAKHKAGHEVSVGEFRFLFEVEQSLALRNSKTFDTLVEPHATRKKYADLGKVWAMLGGRVKYRAGHTFDLGPHGSFRIGAEREREVTAITAFPLPPDPKDGVVRSASEIAKSVANHVKDTMKLAVPADADDLRRLDVTPGSVLVYETRTKVDAGVSFGKMREVFGLTVKANAGVNGSAEKERVKVLERLDAGPDRHVYRVKFMNKEDLIGSSFLGVNVRVNRGAVDATLQSAIDMLAERTGLPDEIVDKGKGKATGALLGAGKVGSRQFAVYRAGEFRTVKISSTEAIVEIPKDKPNGVSPLADNLLGALIAGDEEETKELLAKIDVPNVRVETEKKSHTEGYFFQTMFTGVLFQQNSRPEKAKSEIVISLPGQKAVKKVIETTTVPQTFGGAIPEFFLGMPRTQFTQQLRTTSVDDGERQHQAPFVMALTMKKFGQGDLNAVSVIAKAFGQDWNPADIQKRISQQSGLREGRFNAALLVDDEGIEKLLAAPEARVLWEMGKAQREMEGIGVDDPQNPTGMPPWAVSAEGAAEFEREIINRHGFAPAGDRSAAQPSGELKTYKQRYYENQHEARDVEKDIRVFKAVTTVLSALRQAKTQSSVETAMAAFNSLGSLDKDTLAMAMIVLRRIAGAKLAEFKVDTDYTAQGDFPGVSHVGVPETKLPLPHDEAVDEAAKLPDVVKP